MNAGELVPTLTIWELGWEERADSDVMDTKYLALTSTKGAVLVEA